MKQAHRSIIATALALPLLAMAFAHDIGEAHAASMGYDFSAPSDYGISNGSELQVTGGRAVLRGKDLGFVAGDIAGDLGSSDDVAHGDLDGDGDLDLHISNYNQQNRLWVNDGLGNFTGNDIVGDLGSSFESKMFDVDGDGDLDIYVANYSNQQNRLWVNDGQGNFTGNDIVGDTFPSRGISFGDLDGGGDLDMHVTNNGQNQLWVNDGLGNFAANNIPTDLGDSFSSSVGDIDGDGDLDIHVANLNGEQNRLWVNDGLGNFTGNDIVGDLNHSTGSLMEDIDGDGDLDIYVVNSGAQQNRLWINDGSGSFTAGDIAGDTGNSRFSVIADFNGDGNRDVYIANNAGSNEQNRLWKNDGALNFAPDDIVGDLGASTGATAFDANGDGRQDIYVTNTANQQNRLWVNRGAAYPSTSPYVQPTGPLGFTTLIQSFTETLGTGNQGNVTYQVSTDNGTTWYYWDGSTWTMTIQTDGTESSPAGDIDTNIAGLDTDGGDFLWRAYLNSDGTQAVELDQVDIGHDRVPNAPAGAPDLTAASDSGSSDTDNITNITAPGFELECTGPGNTLSLYTDSPTANTPIGTHSCGTAGPVTITAGTLGEGTHSITYTEANESGEGAGSPALSITIDTTAPTPPATPDLQQGSDTGILNTDNLTSDATPSLDLECPEAGAALILTTDNPSPDTVLASYPSCTLGSLSATLSTMSPDGVHRLILEITDTAGNSTESNPLVLTLDTAILPTTIDAPTRGEPVSGTAEANSGITVATPGGSTCTTTTDNGGNWSCSLFPTPLDGEDITASTVDDAGNNASTTVANGIDRQAPGQPTVDPVAPGDSTITGTGEDGTTIALNLGACANAPVIVAGGVWSCTISSDGAPSRGDTVTATSTDAAGNHSRGSYRIPKPSSGGPRNHSCRDGSATNYSRFGTHKASLCEYDAGVPIQAPTRENPFGGELCPASLIVTDNMKQGDRDGSYGPYNQGVVTQVGLLQAHMNRLLLDEYGNQASGPVDGIFGPLTKRGVERLQQRLNRLLPQMAPLVIDGIVGPFTRAAINVSC